MKQQEEMRIRARERKLEIERLQDERRRRNANSTDVGALLRPPAGSGYSDAHVLRDGSVAMAFQRTFDPPVPSIEGGGYDIGLAIATP